MRQTRVLRHQKHTKLISKHAIPTWAAIKLPWNFCTTCNYNFFRLHVLSNTHKKKAYAFAHDLEKRGWAGLRRGGPIWSHDHLWFINVMNIILIGVCVNSTRQCATVWKWLYEIRQTGTTEGACCQIWRAAENRQVKNNREKNFGNVNSKTLKHFQYIEKIQSGEGSDCVILGYDAV